MNSPANGHSRFGSRATRTESKFGVRPISGQRLETLLTEQKKREQLVESLDDERPNDPTEVDSDVREPRRSFDRGRDQERSR